VVDVGFWFVLINVMNDTAAVVRNYFRDLLLELLVVLGVYCSQF